MRLQTFERIRNRRHFPSNKAICRFSSILQMPRIIVRHLTGKFFKSSWKLFHVTFAIHFKVIALGFISFIDAIAALLIGVAKRNKRCQHFSYISFFPSLPLPSNVKFTWLDCNAFHFWSNQRVKISYRFGQKKNPKSLIYQSLENIF